MQQRVAVTVAEAGQLQLVDVAGHELVCNQTDTEAVGARHIGPTETRIGTEG